MVPLQHMLDGFVNFDPMEKKLGCHPNVPWEVWFLTDTLTDILPHVRIRVCTSYSQRKKANFYEIFGGRRVAA